MKGTRFGKVALLLFYLAEQMKLILERSIVIGVSMLAMLELLSSSNRLFTSSYRAHGVNLNLLYVFGACLSLTASH